MKYIASCSFGKDSIAAIITRLEHGEPIDLALYCRIMFDDTISAELPAHEAKGGKPVEKSIRGLAWVAVRWAATVHPRVIILENVEEFKTWGPLLDGRPDPAQKGRTFTSFVNALRRHGYRVEWQELRACDYGAPTIRKRFFLVARRDRIPVHWPEPTHGDPKSAEVQSGLLLPWRTAAEIIDWTLPCPSIFERRRPLAEATMRRIARGVMRFVVNGPSPFVVDFKFDNASKCVDSPLRTITGVNGYGLVKALLIKYHGEKACGEGNHFGEGRSFLVKYYGRGVGQSVAEPLHTITGRDTFGLVTVKGERYCIADIGLRMLQPHELFAAQGFPSDYIIDRDSEGKLQSKASQVARCGNAVPPPLAEAITMANLPELCMKEAG
ncbi:MAG: DNA cytosine methyltransferase [Peptococcaceae bacterium]|nr:DNA cytosine methyltransferase [Peptococcaceae bacterium]